VSTGSAIIAKLQSFRYEDKHKNFNFNKYVILHVEQHNQHADLQEYGVAPLAENLKTLWLQEGIKCNLVKASINANRSNFTDFDSVKDAHVEFKCTLGSTNDPKTHQVAGHGGRGGGSRPLQPCCVQGLQTNEKCQKGLVPQAEVDRQTHITLRYYSNDEFKRMSPAKKQKLWQLKNPGKTPRTGPTRLDRDRNASVASTVTSSSGSRKRQVEEPVFKDDHFLMTWNGADIGK
jgi:hypothetical protein